MEPWLAARPSNRCAAATAECTGRSRRGGWPRWARPSPRWGWPPAAARPAAGTGPRPRPGGAPPGRRGTPAGAPLCAGTAKVDQVVMRLTAARPEEILPRAMTITAPRAAALAAALCALPRMPARVALPGRPGRGAPAGVHRRGPQLPAGSHPGLGLCQRHRGGPGPAVGLVIAARTAAERGGRRLRPAGARDPSEQRAHASNPVAGRLPSSRPGPRRCTPLPPRSGPLTDG